MNYNPYLITKVVAREILDSRSNPTVEADVFLSGGSIGRAAVPSGASTGRFEAKELRDKDTGRYMGCGVLTAVGNVNDEISEALIGRDARCQKSIDEVLLALDGTENKERLGANAILAVSLACARAAAKMSKTPLYRYLGGVNAVTLPVPMMNILNGGVHADSNLDIQEFMIMPVGFDRFSDALRCGSEVYHALRTILKLKGKSTAIGDEGGFAPDLRDDSEAIELILAAVEKAGYRAGSDVVIALDAAASEWQTEEGGYLLPKQNKRYTSEALAEFWISLCEKYPIVSIEDPFHEEDFAATKLLTEKLGQKLQIVGDDLFVTNIKRLSKGIAERTANSILVKVNQIGSLSESIDAVNLAHRNGYSAIISHRSGETEDTFIADLAVALNAGQIKTGAPCRTDRTAKYNRLLRIEEELGSAAVYLGRAAIKQLKTKNN